MRLQVHLESKTQTSRGKVDSSLAVSWLNSRRICWDNTNGEVFLKTVGRKARKTKKSLHRSKRASKKKAIVGTKDNSIGLKVPGFGTLVMISALYSLPQISSIEAKATSAWCTEVDYTCNVYEEYYSYPYSSCIALFNSLYGASNGICS